MWQRCGDSSLLLPHAGFALLAYVACVGSCMPCADFCGPAVLASDTLQPSVDASTQDVAIAYGYNNIARTIPRAVTIGRELPLNQLTELLRGELAAAGCARSDTFHLSYHAFLSHCIRGIKALPAASSVSISTGTRLLYLWPMLSP